MSQTPSASTATPASNGDTYGRSVRPNRVVLWSILALLLVSLILQLSRVNADHGWTPDFSLYLMHAKNIVEGTPYADTPYFTNPVNGNPSPQAYPPGFPLLLAPVYAVSDGGLIPLKLLVIVLFTASLGLLAVFMREELDGFSLVVLVGAVGLNPYLIEFTSFILSDLPFLFFLLLTLLTWRAGRDSLNTQTAIVLGLAAGALAYYCILIRSLGILVPASLLIFDLVDRRKLARTTWIALCTVAAAYGVHAWITSASEGAVASTGFEQYSELVRLSLLDRLSALMGTLMASIEAYGEWMGEIVFNPRPVPSTLLSNYIMKGWFYLFALFVAVGWLHHVWKRRAVFDVFTALYIGALLPWNFGSPRYLIPVIPFCVFYAVYLLGVIGRRISPGRKSLLIGLVVLLAGIYPWRLFHIPEPTGVYTPEMNAMYEFIRTNTAPDDVIVTGRPRVIALETGRRSVRWFTERSDEEVLEYFDHIGADYVVPVFSDTMYPMRAAPMFRLFREHPERFRLVFESEDVPVYEIY